MSRESIRRNLESAKADPWDENITVYLAEQVPALLAVADAAVRAVEEACGCCRDEHRPLAEALSALDSDTTGGTEAPDPTTT
jgi:hypothetical protein